MENPLVLRVAEWIRDLLEDTDGPRPLMIGINGSQGIGKTTLSGKLCELFAQEERRCFSLSIDDFYLTHAEQLAVARAHPDNPYLQQRGYPGTHDVALGEQVLQALSSPKPDAVRVPRYDKAAFSGQGDRATPETWPEVTKPLDIVLFDGWMLGYTALETAAESGQSVASFADDPHLRAVDRFLPDYDRWYQRLDGLLILEPERIEYVLEWRAEAEEKMRAQGRGGMTAAEIHAYLQKFLPAYRAYLPRLLAHPPIAGPVLKVKIGRDRCPIA